MCAVRDADRVIPGIAGYCPGCAEVPGHSPPCRLDSNVQPSTNNHPPIIQPSASQSASMPQAFNQPAVMGPTISQSSSHYQPDSYQLPANQTQIATEPATNQLPVADGVVPLLQSGLTNRPKLLAVTADGLTKANRLARAGRTASIVPSVFSEFFPLRKAEVMQLVQAHKARDSYLNM